MAPWVPTRSKDVVRLTNRLDLKKWEKFLEIGSWDGRISRAVARTFPASKVIWIEMTFPMFLYSYVRNTFSPIKNLKFIAWNAFKENFSSYDVIYVYGMPDKMSEKIVPKFILEAKKWAKLYSYVFSIPEKYKKDSISYGGKNEAKIHVLEKK